MLQQMVLPKPQRRISDVTLEHAAGAKVFDVSEVLDDAYKIEETFHVRKTIPQEEFPLPFNKIWIEFKSGTEYGMTHPDGRLVEEIAFCVQRNGTRLRCAMVSRTGTVVTLHEPFSIPGSEDHPEQSKVVSFLMLINSSHTESTDHKHSYTTQRKYKRWMSGPLLPWSQVRLKTGYTISVTHKSGKGGWQMPEHEVRGHDHWYRSRTGEPRPGKPGLWVKKWIKPYTRGNSEIGIKRQHYKMTKPSSDLNVGEIVGQSPTQPPSPPQS
jgi:hypothetical protein